MIGGNSLCLNFRYPRILSEGVAENFEKLSKCSQSQNPGPLEYEAEILSNGQPCSVCCFVDTVTNTQNNYYQSHHYHYTDYIHFTARYLSVSA
jgi:hypothetical protein